MGGDDLGSDDDYLKEDIIGTSADNETEENSKKRRLNDNDITKIESGKGEKKAKLSPEKLLIEAGRDLDAQTVEQQASFLETSINHYRMIAGVESDNVKVLSKYLQKSTKQGFADRLGDIVSVSKMKKWKHKGSPCVVIICMSARRAVSVLKELSDLKLRVAKLFPKNGTIEEQIKGLATTSFPVAVGTPHRLLALCQADGPNGRVLNFDRTQCFVLDCFTSNKMFTVCTLPDTAPACMALLRENVLPQCSQRKDARIAFF